MPKLMIALDSGETAALRSCVWVFYEPCGCPRGLVEAVFGDTTLADDETAFRAFFDEGRKRDTLATVQRMRKMGVTAELMTRARYRDEVYPRMLADCAHAEGAAAPEGDAAAKLAKVRDVIAQLREHAADSKYHLEQCAYTDAANWLDEAIGGESA
jgi:hypothetical protein